jgi:RHH-type proline utilization regulon transcriptional repressor/proline dehydrogenase/delta 1-pyrroline-5-carboxylate dehydrogenase
LRETQDDFAQLVRWVRSHGRPVSVRLVKGAYWDTEVALARQREWPVPVYLRKSETDANYERLTRTLFENADLVFPAIAGHNLRSLAHAIAAADATGLPRDRWEIQVLYGMAEPLQAALAQRGASLRVYVPTGELVTGIAYLIRRLLENTASSSVPRQTYAEGQDTAALLAAPAMNETPSSEISPAAAFHGRPLLDFSRSDVREQFAAAIASVAGRAGARYPLSIAGAGATELYPARNPVRPDNILGHVGLTDAAGARTAIANANETWPKWRATPVSERVAIMRRAAVRSSNGAWSSPHGRCSSRRKTGAKRMPTLAKQSITCATTQPRWNGCKAGGRPCSIPAKLTSRASSPAARRSSSRRGISRSPSSPA